jgi:hypothetical protein
MLIISRYITLEVLNNQYLKRLSEYVIARFDTPEYENTVFLIGTGFVKPISHYREQYPDKKLIVYNWEQLCSSNVYTTSPDKFKFNYIEYIKGADEIWDYDELNAKYLELYKIKVNKIVPYTYHSMLEEFNNTTPDIDVLFYGYPNQRRTRILTNIQETAYDQFSIAVVSGFDNKLTNEFIGRAKIVINLHTFEPWHRQEQERIGYLLANKKCVLSEISQTNHFGCAIVERKVEDLYSTIHKLLKNDVWEKVAEKGYLLYKKNKCTKINNY